MRKPPSFRAFSSTGGPKIQFKEPPGATSDGGGREHVRVSRRARSGPGQSRGLYISIEPGEKERAVAIPGSICNLPFCQANPSNNPIQPIQTFSVPDIVSSSSCQERQPPGQEEKQNHGNRQAGGNKTRPYGAGHMAQEVARFLTRCLAQWRG
jgi:hypothetical protein